MTTPHWIFRITRPDVVAECWENVPPDLYSLLWDLASQIPSYKGETPPEPGVGCLASVWHLIPEADKARLNELAHQYERHCHG